MSGRAEAAESPPTRTSANGGFGPVRQVRAGVLDVGYVDLGPAHGTPVVLLHGFPYDIHSYERVAPLLARRGYRVVVPYLRGHGRTVFRSASTPRNVDQAAFALDVLALMDTLGMPPAVLAGYDWGSRTADIIAALWPERVKALVSVSGYLITNLDANKAPLPPAAENAWWYQYYFATERGVNGLRRYKRELGEFIWKFNSPTWKFAPSTYGRTAAAFDNPDYEAIVIGNYRWRLSLLPAEPEYAALEGTLQSVPKITVPTIAVDGRYDPFTPPGDGRSYRAHFTGKYQHRTFDVGHNVPQEAPRDFAQAVIDADRL
ncbi:Pimeloyl-ACP methyl ester carboxylesterase [Actinopolymorpha cephalotaxi]|uniref:Pimeloyl-ACP methyl ester carboxylesterase n=1 Tax=Actinopolymorpha cephalotaxi TaxID=504797 RepID=A0A1I2P8H0_9ACTN|nr:alpha/beta hydrolase [Actinopolymorpha cephalotaxi]NYH83731.1 pimeloyl-ACP methyl ester carboxylesterase [Actinopolymorpha cephalotaxi]SFG11780.1 Pimeloyl-ACP methyl ester carboxylesterase [Actinopolymorpha cephalotaxi]